MSADTPSVGLALADGCATLTLSNPGRRNALTWGMYDQLEELLVRLCDEAGLLVVVLRGDPEGGFAAGTDIQHFRGMSGTQAVEYEHRVGRVLQALTDLPTPVVAAVSGAAVGAGMALACCCDLVVAERGSLFGAPVVRTLGNCLPTAVIARLRERVGAAWTDAMLLAAQLVPAESLTATGFVTLLSEPGNLEEDLATLVRRISRGAPVGQRALMASIGRLAAAVPGNDDLIELAYGSDDFAEGVAAFLEHRRPVWTGR